MELLDNINISITCPKCHIVEEEKIYNLINFNNLKWIKYDNNKNCIIKSNSEFYEILDRYINIISKKTEYILENIEYINTFPLLNSEHKKIYDDTLLNILSIFFRNIQLGKYLLFLFIITQNTFSKKEKRKHKINYNISTAIKNFFILGIKNNCEIRDKDEPKKMLECFNNSMLYKEENYESFSDDVFKKTIGEERENFISFLQFSSNSKKIIKNYISNSLTNKNRNISHLEQKKNYLEETFDFTEALNQYISVEKIKNPNNFIDIYDTLENFDDDYSILNSSKHQDFILALFGKFLEINGTKTYIMKKKIEEFDNIELSSIQTLFSLGSQRKYEIHFDFGKTKNFEILKDKKIQNEFLNKYKEKIANILNINENRIIFKGVKFGTDTVKLAIIDQNLQEEQNIVNLKDELGNVTEINKKVMIDTLLYSKDILDPLGDRHNGWGINESRGGERYIPPLDGWMGIGLKVLDKYENNKWLSYNGGSGEYAIAYYGLNYYLNNNETFIENLNDTIRDIRRTILERTFQTEEDNRTGILGLFRNKCGGGVCLFQDPKYAESSANIFNVNGVEYKILLMCRVNPAKIRQPSRHDKFWILNPVPEEIRPYRILIKRYFNSPLYDNQLKVELNPVNFIMNAINSNNFRPAIRLKNNNIFRNIGYNRDTDTYYDDETFILRLYSSNNFKAINRYMFKNEEILTGSRFNREQLNSIICFLQNTIMNKNNVSNNITVYRGVTRKFPNEINIGSRFYFPSFTSTSKEKSKALGFIGGGVGTLMTINLINNEIGEDLLDYCVDISDNNFSLYPNEEEILLCSHCYFQITNIRRNEKIDYVDLVCRGYLLNIQNN